MTPIDRTTVRIPTPSGFDIEAWLYLPEGQSVSRSRDGYGLGAVKVGGLASFAERFCREGIAAVVIDYRQWGGRRGRRRATSSTSHVNARITSPRSGGPQPNRTSTNAESSCGAHLLPACTPPRWQPLITASRERSPSARWLTVLRVHAWCAPAVPWHFLRRRSSIVSDYLSAARRSICQSMWRPENGASPTHQMRCSARK